MRASVLAAAVAFAVHGSAIAGVIQAQCGTETGFAYTAEQGIVPKGDGGWHEDKTTGSETVIRVDIESSEVDIRFKDATGVWASVTDGGGHATLWSIQANPMSFMVLLTHPAGAIEILTLAEIDRTSAKLIHSVSRNLDTLTNSRVMIASCRMSAF